MTRYFIDITHDRVLFADGMGIELAEPAELRVEVCRQIGEIIRDWLPGRTHLMLDINVRDADGKSAMHGSAQFDLDATAP